MTSVSTAFEYAGHRFIPYATLTEAEREIVTVTKHLRSDNKMNLTTYSKTYTWEEFWAAAGKGSKEIDLFECLDNGRIYIPCSNELFEYITDARLAKQEQPREITEDMINAFNTILAPVSVLRLKPKGSSVDITHKGDTLISNCVVSPTDAFYEMLEAFFWDKYDISLSYNNTRGVFWPR